MALRLRVPLPGAPSHGAGQVNGRLGYIPALDGVRGVAVLAVVFSHLAGWPNGNLGVELFFVLSGFLITTLLIQEWRSTGSVDLGAFYRRRALRLMPALIAGVSVFLLLSGLFAAFGPDAYRPFSESVRAAAFSLLYISNIVQAAGELAPPVIHLWSLATEEQFYVLWPLVLLVALKSRIRMMWVAAALAGVVVVIATHRIDLVRSGVDTWRLYGPDVRFDSLVVGCLFGLVFAAGLASRSSHRTVWVWAPRIGAVVVLALVAVPAEPATLLFAGPLVVFSVSAGFVVLGAVLDETSRVARFLASTWPVRFGRISYGLYVWHMIIMYTPPASDYLPLPVRVPLSIIVAELSYRYIELPFLRQKRSAEAREEATGVPRAVVPAPR
jgi:peptidoglycan/LPS O-acetylase OafA/YrhL